MRSMRQESAHNTFFWPAALFVLLICAYFVTPVLIESGKELDAVRNQEGTTVMTVGSLSPR